MPRRWTGARAFAGAVAMAWLSAGCVPSPSHSAWDLHNIDRQKAELERNTRQFVVGLPANNALLWGSRGTGKSSLIKALLTEYADRGLRLIEVDPHQLTDLPDIVELVRGRSERFIVFCDDLSFEADDATQALKAVLDGSVAGAPMYSSMRLPIVAICCRISQRKPHGPQYGRSTTARRWGENRCRSVSVCGCRSIPSTRTTI